MAVCCVLEGHLGVTYRGELAVGLEFSDTAEPGERVGPQMATADSRGVHFHGEGGPGPGQSPPLPSLYRVSRGRVIEPLRASAKILAHSGRIASSSHRLACKITPICLLPFERFIDRWGRVTQSELEEIVQALAAVVELT